MEAINLENLLNSFSNSGLVKELPNLVKYKRLILKDINSQSYDTKLKLYEKSISIEAVNEKDITNKKYLINLCYKDFIKLNNIFK